MQVLKWIINKNRGWAYLSLVTIIISNASQMLYMFYVGELVNRIEEREDIGTGFVVLMGAFLILNAVTQYLYQIVGRFTSEKAAHTLRIGFIRAKLSGSVRENEEQNAGEIMSIVQNELDSANSYLSNTFFEMISMSISGILVFIFLMFINIWLTLVILIPTVLILIYVIFSGRKLSGIVSKAQDEKANMNRIAYSAIDSHSMVTIFDAKDYIKKAFGRSVDAWCVSEKKKDRLYAVFNSLSGVLSRLPLLLLLLAGSYMVLAGEMLLGTLILFLNLQKSVTQFVMNMPMWLARFKTFTVNLSRIEVK